MEILILGFAVIAVFFFAVLILAMVLSVKYGDSSAAYPLFAVRDNAIDRVVFADVDRTDPWFEFVYSSTNAILRYCNLVNGPGHGWAIGSLIGKKFANDEIKASEKICVPSDVPVPEALIPLLREFSQALDYMTDRHHGHRVSITSEKREIDRRRKAEVREIKRSLASVEMPGLSLA